MPQHVIELPESLDRVMNQRMAEEGYASPAAYLADLVARDQRIEPADDAALGQMLDAAARSGVSDRSLEQIFQLGEQCAKRRG